VPLPENKGTNLFGEICNELIDNPEKAHNILSFCENKTWGLGVELRPVQRFIIKCFYGLPLEEKIKTIEIRDKFREAVLMNLTELEYFHYLVSQKRTNQTKPPTKPFQEIVLVIGRRGTKSTTASFISAYETYNLLQRHNPQDYYNILDADDIRITNVANSVDQATKLFKLIKGHMAKAPFFSRFIPKTGAETHINLLTAYDIEHYGKEAIPKLRVTVAGCNARAIRGGANIVVTLDELAHYLNNLGNRSDSEIYDALTPSTADFRADGKILNLSSPLSRAGKFFELYMQSFDDPDILMLKIPSWEANPEIETQFLKTRWRRDPVKFMQEYGAEFTDAVNAYVEDPERLKTVVTDRAYAQRGSRLKQYFFGIDLGLINDGTSISVGHVEWEERVVQETDGLEGLPKNIDYGRPTAVPVIYHDLTTAFYSGQPPYDEDDTLLLDDMVQEILKLARDFPVQAGVIDQWCGPPLEQALKKNGLDQIEMVHFTQKLNSEIYTTLKTLYLGRQVSIAGGWQSPLVQELLTLEKRMLPNYLIDVEAPKLRGFHDDRSDSLARMIWMAFTRGVSQGGKRAIASHKLGSYTLGGNKPNAGMLPNAIRRRAAYQGRVVPVRGFGR